MSKEIIKVPFEPERVCLAMAYKGYSYSKLAKAIGISDKTIRTGIKNKEIRAEYRAKIAVELDTTEQFLSGDKKFEAVANAFYTVISFLKAAPAMRSREMPVVVPVEHGE